MDQEPRQIEYAEYARPSRDQHFKPPRDQEYNQISRDQALASKKHYPTLASPTIFHQQNQSSPHLEGNYFYHQTFNTKSQKAQLSNPLYNNDEEHYHMKSLNALHAR